MGIMGNSTMAAITMYKYLQDLQTKGYNRIPDEFRLSNLMDLYEQINTLETQLANEIALKGAYVLQCQHQAERLEELRKSIDGMQRGKYVVDINLLAKRVNG